MLFVGIGRVDGYRGSAQVADQIRQMCLLRLGAAFIFISQPLPQ